jgi:hypothetical protein
VLLLPLKPIVLPAKAIAKTKAGKAIIKEVAVDEKDFSGWLTKVDNKLNPYSTAISIAGTGLTIWNTAKLTTLH